MKSREMTCRFISARSSQEWADALDLDASEISFTAEYHVMSEQIWGGEAFLAVIERDGDRLVWPYILQAIFGVPEAWDVNSAYGFVGPLVRMAESPGDPHFVEDALDHLMLRWREMGIVSAFTRFCPFHANHAPVERWLQANQYVNGSVEATGHIVVIDATQTPEQRWSDLRRSLQYDVRKAVEHGFTGEFDPNWERLDDFLRIYESVGDRNQFSARHRLIREDFLTMRRCLGANMAMFHVMHNGRVAASMACLVSDGGMHAFFGGPHPDYLRLGAYKFLLKFLADSASEQGFSYMNLGGGRGGSDKDSLYQFKCGFSSLRLPFYVGRVVVNSAKYEELTGELAHRYRKEGLEPAPHFFPAYRSSGIPVELGVRSEDMQEVSTGVEA
jgi:Acetyltransferase (GNAT) domain